MSTTPVTWTDPPPAKAGRRATVFTPDVLAALRANPGRWALVKATTRKAGKNADGRRIYDIYARYVGEAEQS